MRITTRRKGIERKGKSETSMFHEHHLEERKERKKKKGPDEKASHSPKIGPSLKRLNNENEKKSSSGNTFYRQFLELSSFLGPPKDMLEQGGQNFHPSTPILQ